MSDPTPDPYQKAADRIRDAAKWLLGALAAVGAALLAGLSLSSLGSAEGTRVVVAVVGFALAVAGVLVACGAIGLVVGQSVQVSIDEVSTGRRYEKVRAELARNPALLGGLPVSIETIGPEHARLTAEYGKARAALDADPTNPQRRAAFDAVVTQLKPLDERLPVVLQRAAYFWLRRVFVRNGAVALVAAAVTAAGIGMFAWGANPPAKAKARTLPAVVLTPVEVVVDLTEAGRVAFAGVLGADCPGVDLPGVAIAGGPAGTVRVATAATEDCTAAVIDVAPEQGSVGAPAKGG